MDSFCHGESSSLASHSMDKLSVFDNALKEAEPLGSVTYNQEIDGSTTSLQIRSSARVSKKMRLDSIATPVATVFPDKKDLSKDDEKTEKPEKPEKPEKAEKHDKHEKSDAKQNDGKPKRRTWELWSQEDKNTFFEALNEYGKDFDSIQNHFATKAKKKGLGEHLIKKKDQVRHFYYRTWHKISKHLVFSDDLKNVAKELYGLVNYGEIRKRIGFCTEKIMCMKLNELVYKGTIQLRIKGKTVRIKTPICRALRKLNRVQEYQEDIKLPARVTVELRPRCNETWSRVQAVSQNPRIKTLLPLQGRLTTLLTYLNYRWRPLHMKHRDKLLSALGSSEPGPETEDRKKEKEPLLHVAPPPGVPICLPTFNLTEYLTSSSLCLISYEERFQTWQAEAAAAPLTGKGSGKGCTSRKGGKRQRVDSSSSDKKPVIETLAIKLPTEIPKPPVEASAALSPIVKQKENVCTETEFVDCGKMLDACDNNDVFNSSLLSRDVAGNCKISGADGDINDMAVNHILSLQHHSGDDASAREADLSSVPSVEVHNCGSSEVTSLQKEEVDSKSELVSQLTLNTVVESKVDDNEETINRIRGGWTIEDANAVSIGELYLMYGSDSKLLLEYWWDNVSPVQAEKSPPLQKTTEGEAISESPINSLGETLQKLISIARLNYRKAKVMCPCGHICGSSAKTPAASRRPPPSRAVVDENVGGSNPSAQQVCPAVSVSLTTVQDGVFRRPLLAPSQFKPMPKPGTAEAFKAQLDKFRPRYCNRRGRAVRPKNVVVQRMLPLLPKAPNGHAMVTLKVIPQTSQLSGEFLPIGTTVGSPKPSLSQPAPLLPRPTKNHHILPATPNKNNTGCIPVASTSIGRLPDLGQDITPVKLHQGASNSSARGVIVHKSGPSSVKMESGLTNTVSGNGARKGIQQARMKNSVVIGVTKSEGSVSLQRTVIRNGNSVLHPSESNDDTQTQLILGPSSPPLNTPVSSPPSISNLLELSLHSAVGEELVLTDSTDNGLLDVPIQDHAAVSQPSFEGLLQTEGTLQNAVTPPGSPSRILKDSENQWLNSEISPSRILKETDNQWLNSEVADFSLSSFLGHLESPLKPAAGTSHAEDTRLSSDVEAQLQCLMSENSVDYMAKFADLAAQIAAPDASNKK